MWDVIGCVGMTWQDMAEANGTGVKVADATGADEGTDAEDAEVKGAETKNEDAKDEEEEDTEDKSDRGIGAVLYL